MKIRGMALVGLAIAVWYLKHLFVFSQWHLSFEVNVLICVMQLIVVLVLHGFFAIRIWENGRVLRKGICESCHKASDCIMLEVLITYPRVSGRGNERSECVSINTPLCEVCYTRLKKLCSAFSRFCLLVYFTSGLIWMLLNNGKLGLEVFSLSMFTIGVVSFVLLLSYYNERKRNIVSENPIVRLFLGKGWIFTTIKTINVINVSEIVDKEAYIARIANQADKMEQSQSKIWKHPDAIMIAFLVVCIVTMLFMLFTNR